MSDTTNISLRLPTDLVERIDASASREGQTRTAYIIAWLPDTQPSRTETQQQQAVSNARQS